MSTSFFYIFTDSSPPVNYRGKADWLPNGLEIKLLTENVSYRGMVTARQLEEQYQLLNLPKEEFLEQCRIALFTKGDTSEFHYVLENDCFFIKKRLKMDSSFDINVIFLKISLEEISFAETVIEMLDAAINLNYHQIEETKKLRVKNETLKIDTDNAIKHLKKMETEKISYEETLYQKFLNLLNSKKSRTSNHEAQPILCEQNDNKYIGNPDEEKLTVDRDIFETDTDIDDDDLIAEGEHPVTTSSPTSGACFDDVNQKKANSPDAKENVTSNIDNIMDSMAFLDPTIPF